MQLNTVFEPIRNAFAADSAALPVTGGAGAAVLRAGGAPPARDSHTRSPRWLRCAEAVHAQGRAGPSYRVRCGGRTRGRRGRGFTFRGWRLGVPVGDEGDVVFRPFSPHLLHVILSLRRYQWTIRPMGTPGQQALPHLDSAPTASSPVT